MSFTIPLHPLLSTNIPKFLPKRWCNVLFIQLGARRDKSLKMALTLHILILELPSPIGLSLVALFKVSGSWTLSVLVTLTFINILSILQLFHLTQFFKKNISKKCFPNFQRFPSSRFNSQIQNAK